jgi:FkbM family methyltransferase
MRKELFYDPLLILERLGEWSAEKRRLRRLKGTAAAGLATGHIGSLELLELLQALEIKVIYDVGANVGTWAILAKAVFPEAELHAFEPLDSHVAAFRTAMVSVPKVELHEVALGEADCFAQIHVPSFSDASSMLRMDDREAAKWGLVHERVVTVRVEVLDHRIERLQLPKPDLVKLDIQGYELVALRGAINALKHAKAVLIEVSFSQTDGIYCGQAKFHEVVDFLAGQDFRLEAFGHGMKLGHRLTQADALFIKCVK